MNGKMSSLAADLLTDPDNGIFPREDEIHVNCGCRSNSHGVCPHVMASICGVAHILDGDPSLLFNLRGVSSWELISEPSGSMIEDKTEPVKLIDPFFDISQAIQVKPPELLTPVVVRRRNGQESRRELRESPQIETPQETSDADLAEPPVEKKRRTYRARKARRTKGKWVSIDVDSVYSESQVEEQEKADEELRALESIHNPFFKRDQKEVSPGQAGLGAPLEADSSPLDNAPQSKEETKKREKPTVKDGEQPEIKRAFDSQRGILKKTVHQESDHPGIPAADEGRRSVSSKKKEILNNIKAGKVLTFTKVKGKAPRTTSVESQESARSKKKSLLKKAGDGAGVKITLDAARAALEEKKSHRSNVQSTHEGKKGISPSKKAAGTALTRTRTTMQTITQQKPNRKAGKIENAVSKKGGKTPKAAKAGIPELDFQNVTGRSIKAFRKYLGLSLEEFAYKLDMCLATIRRWEETKGRLALHTPSQEALTKLYRKQLRKEARA
ncbi:MAG: hypothetical protein LBR53_05430 [Deltaproteobacteria bacterium]|nr:hypothetical protein [Deltaproteobacteria bacterium]